MISLEEWNKNEDNKFYKNIYSKHIVRMNVGKLEKEQVAEFFNTLKKYMIDDPDGRFADFIKNENPAFDGYKERLSTSYFEINYVKQTRHNELGKAVKEGDVFVWISAPEIYYILTKRKPNGAPLNSIQRENPDYIPMPEPNKYDFDNDEEYEEEYKKYTDNLATSKIIEVVDRWMPLPGVEHNIDQLNEMAIDYEELTGVDVQAAGPKYYKEWLDNNQYFNFTKIQGGLISMPPKPIFDPVSHLISAKCEDPTKLICSTKSLWVQEYGSVLHNIFDMYSNDKSMDTIMSGKDIINIQKFPKIEFSLSKTNVYTNLLISVKFSDDPSFVADASFCRLMKRKLILKNPVTKEEVELLFNYEFISVNPPTIKKKTEFTARTGGIDRGARRTDNKSGGYDRGARKYDDRKPVERSGYDRSPVESTWRSPRAEIKPVVTPAWSKPLTQSVAAPPARTPSPPPVRTPSPPSARTPSPPPAIERLTITPKGPIVPRNIMIKPKVFTSNKI